MPEKTKLNQNGYLNHFWVETDQLRKAVNILHIYIKDTARTC